MRIEANLNEVLEKGPLPGGLYRFVVRGEPTIEKASTGRDMMVFKIEIVDLDPELRSSCFTTLTHRVVRGDSEGWQTFGMKQIAQACGVPFDETGFDTEDFAGAEGEVIVERELYKGREQARLTQFVVPK